ncbi:hypothetical protein JYT31_02905, partial [Beggiatoa alba]|nr:hypothetical protein [Beggiatoa alba]
IPELNSIFEIPESFDSAITSAELTNLTEQTQLNAALDKLQTDMEQSIRETLMRTMVTLEESLKNQIKIKIEQLKSDIKK